MTLTRPDFEFLGDVAVEHGLDAARFLRDAIAGGLLVDCGPAEVPRGAVQMTPWLFVSVVRPAIPEQLRLGEETA